MIDISCPGAIILLFEVGHERYIHTGDFRYYEGLCDHPIFKQPIDILYLDNTYGNPKYCFPTQQQVIDTLIQLYKKLETGKSIESIVSNQKTLMSWLEPRSNVKAPKIQLVMGTYTIGKEKIVLGLARALGLLIYTCPTKREIWNLIDDSCLQEQLTVDPASAKIHISQMNELNKGFLGKIIQDRPDIDLLLAIKPTVILAN